MKDEYCLLITISNCIATAEQVGACVLQDLGELYGPENVKVKVMDDWRENNEQEAREGKEAT